MDSLGINETFLVSQLCLLGFFVLGFLVALAALFQLRLRPVGDTAKAIWAALIVFVPLAGAVAFWIVAPGTRPAE